MKLLEFINDLFGIENEVSAPILITLLVFITGGAISFIYHRIRSFLQRKDLRELIRTMIKEISSDCIKKELQTKNFYPTLTTDHQKHWTLSFIRINYLNTFFELQFSEVFNGFETYINCSCQRSLKKKAFHKMYSVLDNIKHFETFIKPDIDNFISDFNRHHMKYKDSLTKFNELMDKIRFDLQGREIISGNSPFEDYAIETDKIWKKWLELDEKERVHFKTTYEMLVEPTLVVNRKNWGLVFLLEMNSYLMECKTQYIEMEGVLRRAYLTFKNHSTNYRGTRRVLQTCLKILK